MFIPNHLSRIKNRNFTNLRFIGFITIAVETGEC
jgi:hypothetical protein